MAKLFNVIDPNRSQVSLPAPIKEPKKVVKAVEILTLDLVWERLRKCGVFKDALAYYTGGLYVVALHVDNDKGLRIAGKANDKDYVIAWSKALNDLECNLMAIKLYGAPVINL